MTTFVVACVASAAVALAAQQGDAPPDVAPAPEEPPAADTAPPPDEAAAPPKSDKAPPPPAVISPAARPRPKLAAAPWSATATPPDEDVVSRARADEGPIESRFNVRLDLDTVWNASSSFDLFSDRDTLVYPGIAIGYAILRSERLALIPELGFQGNHTTGGSVLGGAVSSTSLTTLNPYVGVSARWELFPILDLAARVSGGASFLSFDMDTATDSTRLSDDHVAPFLTVGGGFTLRTLDAAFETRSGALRSLVAGLGVESGYVFAGSVDLTPSAAGDGRIDTRYLSLGTLERSGPYVKTSLSARF
jgi:hypothetical protein